MALKQGDGSLAQRHLAGMRFGLGASFSENVLDSTLSLSFNEGCSRLPCLNSFGFFKAAVAYDVLESTSIPTTWQSPPGGFNSQRLYFITAGKIVLTCRGCQSTSVACLQLKMNCFSFGLLPSVPVFETDTLESC